jgi:hypothetical protein
VPSPDRGLLARLDALVALVADRHGLALLPDGRLAAAEARVAARATGLAGRAHGRAPVERDAVELLRCVAEGVGLLRARGDRLEATSLRHAWTQIDQSLRAGLTYAAWCQQATLTGWHMRSRGWPAWAQSGSLCSFSQWSLTTAESLLWRSPIRSARQPQMTFPSSAPPSARRSSTIP